LADLGKLPVHGRQPGVVDEHVDAAEVAVDVLDEPLETVPVPDVADAGRRLRALRAQGLDDLVAGVGLAADDHHLRAGAGKAARHREAEAPGAARDYGHAP